MYVCMYAKSSTMQVVVMNSTLVGFVINGGLYKVMNAKRLLARPSLVSRAVCSVKDGYPGRDFS